MGYLGYSTSMLLFDKVNTDKVSLGRMSLIQHEINTDDAVPIKQKYYRLSPEKLKLLDSELNKMLNNNVIEASHSP